MAFANGPFNTAQESGSGELLPGKHLILSERTFETGLLVGRFAKLDAGSLDNLDASATPVLAGVVLRSPANALENGEAIAAPLPGSVEYVRQGPVTVEVKAGETPAKFGAVFVYNVADADAGKAVAAAGAGIVSANAEFLEEVATNVWSINLNLGA